MTIQNVRKGIWIREKLTAVRYKSVWMIVKTIVLIMILKACKTTMTGFYKTECKNQKLNKAYNNRKFSIKIIFKISQRGLLWIL